MPPHPSNRERSIIVRNWIKRAVGAAALAGGVLALGSAAQAHAASPASRPARAASIDAGACGVVSLGGTQADACASASDAVAVKVHARHVPRASVKETRQLAARHVRGADERLHVTVPAVRATAGLGHHAAKLDAGVGQAATARAGLAMQRNSASGDASGSHGAIHAGAVLAAPTNLGAKDGTAAPRPAAAVDLTVGANNQGGQLHASAELDASADLRNRTRHQGTTTGAGVGANAELGAGKTGTATGGVDGDIRAGARRAAVAGSAGADIDASLGAGDIGTASGSVPITAADLGQAVARGLRTVNATVDQPITGADPGQAVARGLRTVSATGDRPILGSRSPLALGPRAAPGAVAPASQGSVAARLAAARAWAGITVGTGVAAGGRVPPASVRVLSAKPAKMLAMTGAHTFSLLWLALAVLLTGMAALARARSVSPAYPPGSTGPRR
jgi:hypothetical protein